MNDEDFDKLCKSLELAIAHASGEEVKGVVVHTLKPEQSLTKQQIAPTTKRFTSRFIAENGSVQTH